MDSQTVNMESSCSENQLSKPVKTRIVIPPSKKDGKCKAGRFTVKYSLVKKQRPDMPTKKRGRPPTKEQHQHYAVMAADVKTKPGPAKRMKTSSVKAESVPAKPVPVGPVLEEPVPTPEKEDPLRVFNTWMMLLTKSRLGRTPPLPILMEYCWQQFWWKTIVSLTNSVERYKATMHRVLQEGKCSQAQQQVLEVFTRDVCAEHLPIATPVWNEYGKTVNNQ